MSDTSADLRARVLAAAAASPSLTRQQGRVAGRVLLAASVGVAGAIFERAGGFGHGAGRPLATTLALVGGWVVISTALTGLLLRRARSGLTRNPFLLAAAAVGMPIILFLWMGLFYGSYAEPFQAVGYRCLRYTLYMSALPLGAFLSLRRAIEPRYPSALGAGAGAACAAWATVLVDIWCPLTHPRHVLVGHVVPLVAAALLGAALGPFTLGVRRAVTGIAPSAAKR